MKGPARFLRIYILFTLLTLYGCTAHSPQLFIGKEHHAPIEPVGVYAVAGQYIWDSWIVEDEGTLHRYALSAPSDKLTPNERHQHAFVRHAISQNGGVTWQDMGPAIQPSGKKGVWPDKVIWTSSVMIREVDGEKQFLMFITGRNEENNDEMNQSIGVSTSKDGHHFTSPQIILPPTEQVTKLGYDITNDDGIIMAWRDPFVIQDPATRKWHMFFSAKSKDACGTIRPTVGHAIATDNTLMNWQLEEPLKLPQHYRQLEVPYMIARGGKYYLFVSTQNNPTMDNNRDKEAAFRGFVSDETIIGQWELLYTVNEGQETDKIFGHQIYAPTIFEKKRGSGEYGAVTFFSLNTMCPLTGSPIVEIRWRNERPEFMFNKDLGCCLPYNCLD
ncbi:MAG: glycoside hydrolase family 68 protein [Candidatus Thiodiazotropha sp. (ex Epidulcina cf. delphinae)]|nr:glycoside hydrolase family 68 protein [Candidatus Thiodiazotropha sp. (ex Epidulcina cf. delphinae)]